MKKKKLGDSFRSTFRPKDVLVLLIGSLVIYLFIILSTKIQFDYIFGFIIYNLVIGVLMYLFWMSSHKCRIKERIFFGVILFGLILFFTTYIFAFIHEMGHALVAIFRGVPILDFVVYNGGSGIVNIPDSTSNLDKSMISIAGSLSLIIVNSIIIGVLCAKKTLPFEIFLPIFVIIGQGILWQIEYWLISIVNNIYDAALFLSANPSINADWLYSVFNFVYIYGLIILILLFLYKTIFKTIAFLGEQIPDMNFDFSVI